MTAYASVDELEVRMRTTFSESDSAYAEAKLEEIGAYLAQVVTIDENDANQAENLKYASLYMAQRVMESVQASDVSSVTMQAGAYMQTTSYAKPYGSNNWHKLLMASGYAALLGVGGRVGFAQPSYGLEPANV